MEKFQFSRFPHSSNIKLLLLLCQGTMKNEKWKINKYSSSLSFVHSLSLTVYHSADTFSHFSRLFLLLFHIPSPFFPFFSKISLVLPSPFSYAFLHSCHVFSHSHSLPLARWWWWWNILTFSCAPHSPIQCWWWGLLAQWSLWRQELWIYECSPGDMCVV